MAKNRAMLPTGSNRTYSDISLVKTRLLADAKAHVPLGIFKRRDIGVLEALVLYLKSQDLSLSEIGRILNRDPRTIWTVNEQAKKKQKGSAGSNDLPVPIEIFRDRAIGVLEALAGFLYEIGYSASDIADATDRNVQTIYTALRRLHEKQRKPERKAIELPVELEALSPYALSLGKSREEVLMLATDETETIDDVPLAIFTQRELGILEALTFHLADEKSLRTSDIARRIGRSTSVVAATLSNARAKGVKLPEGEMRVPVHIFTSRRPLEALALHLYSIGLNVPDIARLTARDARTIWTVLHRAGVRSK